MQDLEIKLDRLADGELSHDEYAVLLSSLDNHEDGWKRCALALLEGQALRSELRGLVAEPPVEQQVQAKRPQPRNHRLWSQLLTLAACLGLTFWLGRNSTLVPSSSRPGPEQLGQLEKPALPEARPRQGEMTLVVNGIDGQPKTMRVPVVDGEYVDPRVVLTRNTEIPDDVLAAIKQSGHKIETHREFMRQKVDDQHDVVLPVDRLRVVPVSQPMY